MNIAIFTDTYHPQINGVVTSVRMLEKELWQMGHKVYIFTTTDPEADRPKPYVYRLPSMPFIFLPSHRMALMYPPKLLMGIKKLKIDVIHTQTEFPVGVLGKVISEFFKIPIVHTYHTMYEDYVHYIAGGHIITRPMAQKYSRIFCNGADAVIAPVEKARESLLQYGVNKPIHVIPTGLDFTPFDPARFTPEEIRGVREELSLSPNDPIILSVGRLGKEKSHHVVINQLPTLLQKYPGARLVLVGDGPCREGLQQLAARIGVGHAVLFTGYKPWDSIGKYYQAADVFVSASTSETQGLTYLEAMAGKIPVVVKKDKSVEGIVRHGETGLFFERDEELADTLSQVLQDREKARHLSENAYAGIQHLSSARFAQNLEDVYRNVIRSTPQANQKKERSFFIRKHKEDGMKTGND